MSPKYYLQTLNLLHKEFPYILHYYSVLLYFLTIIDIITTYLYKLISIILQLLTFIIHVTSLLVLFVVQWCIFFSISLVLIYINYIIFILDVSFKQW
jgi:hypothetical protein